MCRTFSALQDRPRSDYAFLTLPTGGSPVRPARNTTMTAAREPDGQPGPPAATTQRRLVPGEARDGGYRPLNPADGERHVVRAELLGGSLPAGWERAATPLLVIAHLSDTHVMDHQSPGRAELVDRYS